MRFDEQLHIRVLTGGEDGDGTLLASASNDATVRLWNLSSGRCHCALRVSARDAAGVLHVSESQFIAMLEEWSGLSAIYPDLRVRLPDHSPAVQRLAQAYVEMDAHGSREPFYEVLEQADTPAERARLVHAVHTLLGEGHVDVIAAAAAAYELSTDSRELFSEWLMEAVAVRMSELVAETMLSEAHSDSAEHDRDAGLAETGRLTAAPRRRCTCRVDAGTHTWRRAPSGRVGPALQAAELDRFGGVCPALAVEGACSPRDGKPTKHNDYMITDPRTRPPASTDATARQPRVDPAAG
jgi:hypothetical protein